MTEVFNHPFYMDHIKLFAKDDTYLKGILNTLKCFIDGISMDFGLDTCLRETFKTENYGNTLADLDIVSKLGNWKKNTPIHN